MSPKARARARTWAAVYRAVFAACGNRCQVGADGCTHWATDGHHKLPKSQGGTDEAWNCLPACRRCHEFVEQHRAWAYARGFLIRRNGGAE